MQSKIGRYDVEAELGRGGMATVYRAYDPGFRREVAIKVLPREFLHDPQFRARFEREAQIIASLEHPAIVPVYDFGEEDGQPYLVMRLMTGGSLAGRLAAGPLPLAEAARIFARLAPALDKAHAQGIIHRDLKPGNILFDADDNPYISDFGIAKLTEATATFTGSGVIGTPAYMSPEQARGDRSIDGRSDLYALGAIVFQMLTGRLPYEADTPMGLAVKHITEPTPHILETKPDLPPGCEDLIQTAMAKDRDQRYRTAGGLAEALATLAAGARTPVTAQPAEITAPAPELISPAVEPEPPVYPQEATPAIPGPEEVEQLTTPSPTPPTIPQPTPTAARPRRRAWVVAGAIGLGGLALGAALMLGRGATPVATDPPVTPTPSVAASRAPSVSPPSTVTPAPTSTALTTFTPRPTLRPTRTSTPQPAWVADFAEPILAAIANQPPDFQDDFSTRAGEWTGAEWCADARLKYVDGEMVLSDCHVERKMWYADFVVEMDVRFPPGSSPDSQMRFNYRRDTSPGGGAPYFIDIEYSGAVQIGFEELGSPGKYTMVSEAGRPGANVNNHVLVVVKDQAVALYVNDRPVYYGALPILWKNGGMSFSGTFAVDNFKVWGISDLTLAAAPPASAAADQPAWVADFAEPILAAIADQKPDFQDDFSTRAGGWKLEEWCATRGRLEIANGEMTVSECRVWREMWYPDFVAELDARFLPGAPPDSYWSFWYRHRNVIPSDSHGYTFRIDGDVRAGFAETEGDIDLQGAALPGTDVNHVLVIAKGQAFALYINGRPVFYQLREPIWPNGGMRMNIEDAVAFDNFKVWDISDLPLAATPAP